MEKILIIGVAFLVLFRDEVKNWFKMRGEGFFGHYDRASLLKEAKQALAGIASKYGWTYAKQIEQSIRHESAHFKTATATLCHASGMECFDDAFPYGWPALAVWAEKKGLNSNQFDKVKLTEGGTGKKKFYVQFPSITAGLNFQAWFIQNYRNGNVGKWWSLKSPEVYLERISKVTPTFCNELIDGK